MLIQHLPSEGVNGRGRVSEVSSQEVFGDFPLSSGSHRGSSHDSLGRDPRDALSEDPAEAAARNERGGRGKGTTCWA